MKIESNFVAGRRERRSAYKTLVYDANTMLGICEMLRLAYDLVATGTDPALRDAITDKLVDAVVMAKKMDARLMYYRNTYKDTTGHNGINLIALANNADRKKMRRDRYGK